MYNFNCLCHEVMNLMYNLNKQSEIDFLSTIKRRYCPLSPIPSAVLSTALPLAY